MGVFSFSDLLDLTNASLRTEKKHFLPYITASVPEGGMLHLNFAKEAVENSMDELFVKRKEAEMLADAALPLIKKQIDKSCEVLESLGKRQTFLMDIKGAMLVMKNSSQDWIQESARSLAGFNAELIDIQKELSEAYEYLDKKKGEAEAKRAKLKKWCWVPFYNLSLLSDFESVKNRYYSCVERLNQKRQDINQKISELQKKMDEVSEDQKGSLWLSILMDKDLTGITENINRLNKMTYQWNEFYRFFIALKADILSLEELEEMMSEAKIQMKLAAEEEKKVDDCIFFVSDFESGYYTLQTFDGVFGVVPGDRGEPPMICPCRSKKQEIEESPAMRDDTWILICLLDNSVIVMSDRHLALTFSGEHGLSFSPVKVQEIERTTGAGAGEPDIVPAPSQRFYIEPYSDEEKIYRLCLYENRDLCLDVTCGAFKENTLLQLWEKNDTVSQKFKLLRHPMTDIIQ